MRDRLNNSGVPVITLQPTIYMDNLAAPFAAPAIVNDGIFAYPIEPNWSISWISHRTLADFVLAAARYGSAGNRELLIGGLEALTANEMCAILSETLGRPVRLNRISFIKVKFIIVIVKSAAIKHKCLVLSGEAIAILVMALR